MPLPNYVNNDDLLDRLGRKVRFYNTYSIPIGVRRIDENWCEIFQYARIMDYDCFTTILRIRLNDEQLISFQKLLEEFCVNWSVLYYK
jgi:hypothetical protein